MWRMEPGDTPRANGGQLCYSHFQVNLQSISQVDNTGADHMWWPEDCVLSSWSRMRRKRKGSDFFAKDVDSRESIGLLLTV